MNLACDNGRTVAMQDFNLVATGFDVNPYLEQLEANPDLWDKRDFRKVSRYNGQLSPHRESNDIWVRHQSYDGLGEYDKPEGADSVHIPRISEWYPESLRLPAAFDMAQEVCRGVGAIQMGGSYVIRLKAGTKVYPHRDFSWHSTYYNKYMVILKTQDGVKFGWERSGILIPETGDLWNFENDTVHWVINDSDEDMLIAIFSIRTFDMDRRETFK